jgi:hypothetical protein
MAKVLAWRGDVESSARVDPREDGSELFISARARARGLHSLDDLKLEVLRQRPTWWAGATYHCPLCDVDFGTAQRAAEHVVLDQHPVLRMD